MSNKNMLIPALVSALALSAGPAMAAGGDDYSSVLSGLAVATIVTAIIAAGALKASPNFAKWAVNKLAGFFR